jgi:predicted site-specific integrase-resolvase
MYVRGKTLSEEFGVSADTLRRWANDGHVRCQRINGNGKRFYHYEDVKRMFGRRDESQPGEEKKKIAYARVSSAKQQEDLQRQVAALQAAYPQHEIVSDVGSGLNWKRKGLQTILEHALRGMVAEVVVMHKDRLCRFGFELIEFVLQKSGAKLLVHSASNDDHKSHEQELAEDLLAIVTVFAARNHGKRKYGSGSKARTPAAKRQRSNADADGDEKDQDSSDDEREENNTGVDGRCALDVQQGGATSNGITREQTASTEQTTAA